MSVVQEEVLRLRAELAAEKDTNRKWAALHSQLTALCEKSMLAPLPGVVT